MPLRAFCALPDLSHRAALSKLLQRLVHDNLDAAVLDAVEGAVADSGGHDVRDGDSLAGVVAEVVADQPGKLAAFEIPGPELDAARRSCPR